MEEIKSIYIKIKHTIEKRLNEFKEVLEKNDQRELFAEFSFCLLTPQSKAKICWKAIENLFETGILFMGSAKDIENLLTGVRFKYKKSTYITEARKNYFKNGNFFVLDRIRSLNPVDARDWLVKNIKGMGMKEASHFLRNIGIGENLAILDRHILKNLKMAGVINEIPGNLSRRKYMEIEKKMRKFSGEINIPFPHLDLLFWYKETGEVFK